MPVYHLTRRNGVAEHGETISFLIAADDESEARALAQRHGGEECIVPFWTDSWRTDCAEVAPADSRILSRHSIPHKEPSQ